MVDHGFTAVSATSSLEVFTADVAAKMSLDLFAFGQKIARENGLILVDTKYEIGKDASGKIKFVDEIIPYLLEGDLQDILQMRNIHVRILGEEYREKDFTGRDICKKRDIKLYFNERDHRFSSSDLRERVERTNNGDS